MKNKPRYRESWRDGYLSAARFLEQLSHNVELDSEWRNAYATAAHQLRSHLIQTMEVKG